MNRTLIVFLVILGSGAAVLLGYAISHRYINNSRTQGGEKMRAEFCAGEQKQAFYMAQVRARNKEDVLSHCC